MNEPLAQAATGTLATAMPLWLGLVLSVLAVAAWAALRVLRWRLRPRMARHWQLGARLAGAGLAWLAATICLGTLGRLVTLAHPWPVWIPAALAAVGLEGVPALYALERRTLPHRLGRALVALRVSSVLLLVLLLVQPVYTRDRTRTEEREVVVLVDASASMRLSDAYDSPRDRLRLAAMADPSLPLPPSNSVTRLQSAARGLAAQGQSLSAWAATLDALDPAPRAAAMDREGAPRRAWLAGATGRIREPLAAAEVDLAPLAREDTNAVARVRQVAEGACAAADAALRAWPATNAPPPGAPAPTLLAPACATLAKALDDFAAAAEALDEAMAASFLAGAPAAVRQAAEAAGRLPRVEVARRLLAAGAKERPAWIDRLRARYRVRGFAFAAEPAAMEWTALLASLRPDAAPDSIERLPPALQATDTARALDAAAEAVPDRKLSGVVLIGDGRDTRPEALDAAVRRLAARGVPVCAVAVGGDTSPLDAAVTGAEAPDTLYLKDRLTVRAALRFDWLAGSTGRVSLWREGRQLDAKTLAVTGAHFRASVDLTNTPDSAGTQLFEVRVEPARGEAALENNRRTFPVRVADDRTHLLVADYRSRWETRYLRSFFAGRDPNVQLQYVLLRPDRVEGQPEPTPVAASAARPYGDVEATALPDSAAAWMSFDAIVLGDIPRAALGPAAEQALKDYVERRGGTLILVAGPQHLPAGYAGSPLEPLFPFECGRGAELRWDHEPFRVQLTAEGAEHPITRLAADPQENLALWNSFPQAFSRLGVRDTRGSAELLAFAEPERGAAEGADATDAEAAARSRLAAQRRSGLLAAQNAGAGRVLMFAYDQSWRMRLFSGDTHHYAFWGQVVRWATQGHLPFGSAHVRFGTDRAAYRAGDSATFSARITGPDFAPVQDGSVAVELRDGERVAATQALAPVAGVPGLYRGTLDRLERGTYRAVLRSAAADRLLAADGAEAPFATALVVTADGGTELNELSADRTALENLAARAGGLAATPFDAERVLERLGPPSERIVTPVRVPLWNTWPLFLLLVSALTAEWMLRKRRGLI